MTGLAGLFLTDLIHLHVHPIAPLMVYYRAILLLVTLLLSLSLEAAMFDRHARTLVTEDNFNNKQVWTEVAKTEDSSIKALLRLLERSKAGKNILRMAERKALSQGLLLSDILFAGPGSICDTTLVRRFSKNNPGRISYETRSKIYINRNLSVVDAVLDIAHELTHYSLRTQFNPYGNSFDLSAFVHSTIEGQGGEVDAYMSECRVYQELFPKETRANNNCSHIIDPQTGVFSRERTVRLFYQMGSDLEEFNHELRTHNISKEDFPDLQAGPPVFISSDYGVPYPVAAMREYASIMERVCQNDQKRVAIIEDKMGKGRNLASLSGHETGMSDDLDSRSDLEKKCQRFLKE